jgi:heterodisulfide reductase subunit B
MRYLYYPGCSLESSAIAYDVSTRWVFSTLGCELTEIEDWNCCGATMYMSTKETISVVVSARNLALAERMGGDIVAPCSSCYVVLRKTNKLLKENFILRAKVNQSLKRAGLRYDLGVNVRHPLDVLVNDLGVDTISKKVVIPLDGLRIANYYGCQIVRPEGVFDDAEAPTTMDLLFEKLGAENVYYPMKVRCCGGMLMTTFQDVALDLCKEILESAVENDADCIVTTCPLCQMNLDGYQKKINKVHGTDFRIPILFFTQLLALSLGAKSSDAAIDSNLTHVGEKVRGVAV